MWCETTDKRPTVGNQDYRSRPERVSCRGRRMTRRIEHDVQGACGMEAARTFRCWLTMRAQT